MAPKCNPQCDHSDFKPNWKGKQCANPPSHHDAGDQAGLLSQLAGGSHDPPPPGHKSKKSKKKKKNQELLGDKISSNDSIMHDLGGPDPQKSHFLSLPWATAIVNPGKSTSRAWPGPSTTDVSPLPSPAFRLCKDFSSSTSSLLQPLTHNDNSSSVSS
jgi:hypothetical protein